MRKFFTSGACAAALLGVGGVGAATDASTVSPTSGSVCEPNQLTTPVTALHVLPDDRMLVAREGAGGGADSFLELRDADGVLVNTFGAWKFNSSINAVTADTTHAYVGGAFTTANGVKTTRVARFELSSRNMDSTWRANVEDTMLDTVTSLLVDSTGGLLVGGYDVLDVGGVKKNLVRLTSAGAIDNTYTTRTSLSGGARLQALEPIPSSTDVYALFSENGTWAVQRIPQAGAASKVDVGTGWYVEAYGPPILTPGNRDGEGYGLAVTPSGGVIATGRERAGEFSPTGDAQQFGGTDPNLSVRKRTPVAHVRDGQNGFLFGGSVTGGKGLQRANLEGTLDDSFQARYNALNFSNQTFNAIAVQSDERIILGGDITVEQSADADVAAENLIRLNADGTIDPNFNVDSVPEVGCADPDGQDTMAPGVTITRAGSGTLGVGDTDTITFTLTEAATDFTVHDITVTGGTLTDFAGSGTSYTATFTPAANANGNATINIAAGTFTDAATNANTAATELALPYNTIEAAASSGPRVPGRVPPWPVAIAEPDGTVTVQWAEPFQDGAGPITGYRVESSPNGGQCTTAALDTEPLSCEINGLDPDVDYLFEVFASNSLGESLGRLTQQAIRPAPQAPATTTPETVPESTPPEATSPRLPTTGANNDLAAWSLLLLTAGALAVMRFRRSNVPRP